VESDGSQGQPVCDQQPVRLHGGARAGATLSQVGVVCVLCAFFDVSVGVDVSVCEGSCGCGSGCVDGECVCAGR